MSGEIRRPTYTTKDPVTGEKVKRQSKVWWIRWYRDGRRHEESSGSTKKGDAERLLKIREGDVAKGLAVTAASGRLRFEDAVADVVNDYTTNGKKTAEQVARRIRVHLLPFFGGRRMAAITTAEARAYVAKRLEEGAARATINRELAIVKRAFSLAAQAGTVMNRPHIPMLAEDNVRQGFFERDQFEDVRKALPEPLRDVMTFAYLSGWRVQSEVVTIEWSQVDRNTKVIRLEPGTTKNSEGRTLPYGALPELDEVMEARWEAHQQLAQAGRICPLVFHRDGRAIKDYRKAWSSACSAAGIPGKLVHDFRRTAVRNLSRAGVPDTVGMRVTGHKTPSVYSRYNISSEADLREAVGRLARAAGKEKGKIAEAGKVRQFQAKG